MKRTYAELMKEIEEKWTVENVTAVLDEMGIEYELVDEEGEQKVSVNEMNEKKEIKYRLQHKATGQYVSYLGIERYKKDSLLPEKIDAIEFVDDYEDAEVFTYVYTDLDASGKLIYNPMEKLELFYCKFFLGVKQVEEERYLFYSEELDNYFNYIEVESNLSNATSFVLDSVPHESLSTHDLRESGTKDSRIIELFEQNTNFHKVKVSDLD